jgi:ABC-type multidrug transport system ATPase subunit
LLDNVWGEVPQKETTAIMLGPAGKTSCSTFSLVVRNSAALSVQADIRLNKYRVDPTNMNVRKLIAFVAQEDSLQVTATAREAIYFSAKLRLPRSTTERELETLTTACLRSSDCWIAPTRRSADISKGHFRWRTQNALPLVWSLSKPNLCL